MTGFLSFFALLLAAFGAAGLGWLVLGALLLPVSCPARAVITARDRADGLEQSVKALLWLRRTGLWRGVVVIEDGGLDEYGTALAKALAKRYEVTLIHTDYRRIPPY